MVRLLPGDIAPDFTLYDHKNTAHQLSIIYGEKNVLMVFNLGFV